MRAIVLQTLGEAYQKSQGPKIAVRHFLASIGSLFIGGIVWAMFNIGFGAPFALLANPRAQHLLGIPALVLVAECAITLYFFRGDARCEAARVQAAADDAYDWIFLATFYLPPMLLVAFIAFMVTWHEPALEAWFDHPDPTPLLPPLLCYGAVYFCVKAILLAHVHTASFDRSGERLLGKRWIQGLLMRSDEERAKEFDDIRYRQQALAHEPVSPVRESHKRR